MSSEDEVFNKLSRLDPTTGYIISEKNWTEDEGVILSTLLNAIGNPSRGNRGRKPRRWFWRLESLPGTSFMATIYDSKNRLDVAEYRYIGEVLSVGEGGSPAMAIIQAYINALSLFIETTR